MKKNMSWKFTDESSITFQSSVSRPGEFGPRLVSLQFICGKQMSYWDIGLFLIQNLLHENRVVLFFGFLQHFHQKHLLLEDLAWLFLDCCVFWTKQDHSRKVWFKYNIARRYFWHNYCWKLIQNGKYMFLLESHHYIFRNLGEITYFCMFFPGLLYDCFSVGWYF